MLGLLLLALLAWIGVRAVQVKGDLESARGALTGLDADPAELAASVDLVRLAAEETSSAVRRTGDPVWRLAEHVPWLGDDLYAVRVVAVAADAVARGAVLPLVSEPEALDPASLRLPEGGVDLAALSRTGDLVQRADALAVSAAADVGGIDRSGLTGPVDDAVADMSAALDDLVRRTGPLARAVRLVPPMMGADGTRRYLLAFQNPAEARGTGGIVGLWSVLELDEGRLHIVETGANNDLPKLAAPPADLGPEYAALWGLRPSVSDNMTMSPHFPYAAQQLLALWRSFRGEQLDGVVSMDPVALAYLLDGTGGIELASGEEVTAENVVELTLDEVYRRYEGDQSARRDYLAEMVDAVFATLTGPGSDPADLLRGLSHGTSERRLMIYSADADEQADLVAGGLAGTLPDARSSVGVVVNNAGANKLDYYLDRSVAYVPGCHGDPATLTLVLGNAAPLSGLPSYIDAHRIPDLETTPSTSRLLVSAYVPGTTGLDGFFAVDGEARPVSAGRELGYSVLTATVDVPAGAELDLVWTLDASGSPPVTDLFGQPLVRPIAIDLASTSTGCRE